MNLIKLTIFWNDDSKCTFFFKSVDRIIAHLTSETGSQTAIEFFFSQRKFANVLVYYKEKWPSAELLFFFYFLFTSVNVIFHQIGVCFFFSSLSLLLERVFEWLAHICLFYASFKQSHNAHKNKNKCVKWKKYTRGAIWGFIGPFCEPDISMKCQ